MRRSALALGLLMAGCGAQSPPPTAVSSRPADQCGAVELQHLVGRPRTEIPAPVDPRRRRVVCTTCPRTMDYDPSRLTIEYDPATDRVTKAECG